jgi:6-phosphogluconate dehydrogenase
MPKQSVGLIGCGVMGQNLALNIAIHGYPVAVYDSDREKVRVYLESKAAGKNIVGAKSLADVSGRLEQPRPIILMIPAGRPVDQCIEELVPHLEPNDVLIDAGNSHFDDTYRRSKDLEKTGVLFMGVGVSGGEEGALKGPSIMVGGSRAAWENVKPVLQAIAARAKDGSDCCDWVGENPAGHFVKMVHNGIEYGNMQLICEVFHLMKECLGMSLDEMSDNFDEWNRGELSSYLVEITRDCLRYRDEKGEPLIDKILDRAGAKGTGKWTAVAAMDLGQPFTLATSAVFARCLSALKGERSEAAAIFAGPVHSSGCDKGGLLNDLSEALLASMVVSYAQGFQLIRAAEKEHCQGVDLGRVAQLWRAGCIVRSAILGKISAAFQRDPNLANLLLDPTFANMIVRSQPAWRRVVTAAVSHGIPVPAMTSSLSYFDSYRNKWLPANLLQAMRDYFGDHGYERSDRPRGELFHTDWTGKGGETRIH